MTGKNNFIKGGMEIYGKLLKRGGGSSKIRFNETIVYL